MQQKSGDHWWPLGFFSRKLTDTKTRFSTFDRELWLPMQPSNISAIFAKVELFNFGQIINHLSLPFLVFQPSFHPDNSAIWHTFQSLIGKCCIYPVWKMLLPIFCPAQSNYHWISRRGIGGRPSGFRTDGPETQRLLGGTSLKLAFRQTGAQRLAGDVSTGNFSPNCSPQIQKKHFWSFSQCCSPREVCLPLYNFIKVCVVRSFRQCHRLGPRVSGLPAGQDPPPHTPGPPPHPHPATAFFSSTCWFGRPIAVQ